MVGQPPVRALDDRLRVAPEAARGGRAICAGAKRRLADLFRPEEGGDDEEDHARPSTGPSVSQHEPNHVERGEDGEEERSQEHRPRGEP